MSTRAFDLPQGMDPDEHAAFQPKTLEPDYHIGVDLGQSADHSAIAVVERREERLGRDGTPAGVPERGFSYYDRRAITLKIRTLERIELGTDYLDVVDRIKDYMEAPELTTKRTFQVLGEGDFLPRKIERSAPPSMAVDITGVGAAVADMLRHQGLEFIPVSITGGQQVNVKAGIHYVPKVELVGPMAPAMDSGWLRMPSTLPLYSVFRKELENFGAKQSERTGHTSYEAWREGEHDDLVLAVAMGIYSATRRRPHYMSGSFNPQLVLG
jgi:hypothetical protein